MIEILFTFIFEIDYVYMHYLLIFTLYMSRNL